MIEPEVPLGGGLVSGEVVRVGNTVRRPSTPQTATVHRTLGHVRAQGVDWVPAAHGIDEQGREILDFIPGDVGHGSPEWIFSRANLVTVAKALRQWHDATASFPQTPEDVWWDAPLEPQEVICAIDFAPYNHVFRDGQWVGAFDLDLCMPGPRLWDIAHTAYRYVPLAPGPDAGVTGDAARERSPFELAEQLDRLEIFLTAYAGEDAAFRYQRDEALVWVERRLLAMATWGERQGGTDHPVHARMYRAHAHWVGALTGR